MVKYSAGIALDVGSTANAAEGPIDTVEVMPFRDSSEIAPRQLIDAFPLEPAPFSIRMGGPRG
jgi:hypothetical protein